MKPSFAANSSASLGPRLGGEGKEMRRKGREEQGVQRGREERWRGREERWKEREERWRGEKMGEGEEKQDIMVTSTSWSKP